MSYTVHCFVKYLFKIITIVFWKYSDRNMIGLGLIKECYPGRALCGSVKLAQRSVIDIQLSTSLVEPARHSSSTTGSTAKIHTYVKIKIRRASSTFQLNCQLNSKILIHMFRFWHIYVFCCWAGGWAGMSSWLNGHWSKHMYEHIQSWASGWTGMSSWLTGLWFWLIYVFLL